MTMPLQEGITEVIKPIPQERILEHMDEQFMGVWETIPQQHISEHIFEQSEDVPMPQITVPVAFQEETDEVIQSFPAERTIARIVDTSVPQIQEQIVQVAKIIPQGRTPEHTVGVPAPQILEEIVEVVKAGSAVNIDPQERISERSCEQIVDAPVAVDEVASQC